MAAPHTSPQLVNEIPLAVNPEHHARIIHEKACLRRLIHKSNEITKRCFEDQDDVDGVIDFAENAIFEISDNKIKPSFFSISSIIDKNIDELEERQANKALLTGVPTGFSRLDALTSGLQGVGSDHSGGTAGHGQDRLRTESRPQRRRGQWCPHSCFLS